MTDEQQILAEQKLIPGRPKLWKVLALIGSIMVVVFGLTFGWVAYQHSQEQIRCERSVEGRIDNRAMWEYLLEINEDATEPRVVAFTKELDKRLPVLECVNRTPTPIGEN